MILLQVGQPTSAPASTVTALSLDTSQPSAKVRLSGPITLKLAAGNYGGQPFALKLCEPAVVYPVVLSPSSMTVPALPANTCTLLALVWDSDPAAMYWMVPPLSVGPTGLPGTNGINGTNGTNGVGIQGVAGTNASIPAFTFTATGLAAGSTPTATLTGTYPALNVALGIPAGSSGTNGTNGVNGTTPAPPAFTATATPLAAGAAPTASVSGTYPNLALAIGVPAATTGSTGPAGVLYYGTSGALTNVKCSIQAVTSTTAGAWSVNYANAGITTLISLQVNAKSTGTTAATTYQPSTVTATATGASGIVYGYSTSVLGLIPLTQATIATTVMVDACGT